MSQLKPNTGDIGFPPDPTILDRDLEYELDLTVGSMDGYSNTI